TLADGKVQTLGRIDRQIKIRGFRVEPAEIEGLLLSHPTLREAAVLAAPPGRLVAFAVPEEGHEPNPEAVRRWLLERLPEVMMPTRVFCLEALPETPNGKVDEQALRVFADRAFADRARVPRDGPPSSAAGPLGNTEERAIAEAWRRVLGVETVGLDDNFFDVGGHSLLTLEVQQRLEETFGRSLPVVDLFRFPTIRTLATHLRGEVGQLHPSPSEAAPRELSSAIAIIGLAGRFPGARNVDELWRNLAAGVESIRHFDRQQLLDRGVPEGQIDHPDFVAAEGAMDGMELFDAAFFDIAPREAQILDPQQRHFLECAWEALEHAGYDPNRYDSSIGVFAGCGRNDYEWRATADPQIRAALSRYQISLANLADFLPTRVSYKLDLKGPSIAVQTACSTSLVAIHLACQSLLDGDCQMALAGGVSLFTRPPGYLYEPSGIFSPDGLCRAFDARAAGTVTGNGVGIVVLKPLADAVTEGDSIHAVIRGSAANNDGSLKAGFTAPGVEGQVAVIRAALRRAGIEPESIRYLEAHGTGTELGDPIEVAALNRVYAAEGNGGRCALGSVKTNLGHLDTAAGVTGLIKAVLTLKHRRIPPSLHFERPNPQIDFAASPFYVPTELTPWPAEGQPRRAAVSSFGLGGTNAHVVLEEAPRPSSQPPSQPEPALELLLLSARTAPALALASDRLADHLEAHPDLLLSDVAHTLRLGRRPLGHRRIVCCRDRQQAVAALRQPNAGRREAAVIDSQGPERPVAFLFPGQGAQYPGMAADLYAAEPLFRDTLDDASEILRSELDLHLGELILASAEDAEAQARMTTASCAHPALFAVEVGLAKIWRAWGVEPEAMLGYSLGEYVAAHLAGVFTFAEGLRLIATRGRLMESLPGGGMLAVGLSESEVSRRLQQPDLRELSLAAINAADACVVSGPSGAIATLARRLEDEAVELQHVRASHAFHSPMMEPILEPFGAALATIDLRPPQIPYLSSRTGTWIRPEEATDPRYWAECLRRPVRFADGLAKLLESPECVLLEVSPGQILTRLARRQLPRTESQRAQSSLGSPDDERSESERLLTALGRLWLAGAQIDWSALASRRSGRRVPLPTYPFEHQRYWIDTPVGTGLSQPRGDPRAPMADWFYVPFWKPSALPRASAPANGEPAVERWLMLTRESDLGAQLGERLRHQGHEVVQVVPADRFERRGKVYGLRPDSAEDYKALLEDLADSGLPRLCLHSWSLSSTELAGSAPGDVASLRQLGHESLLLLGQALTEHATTEIRLTVVSDRLYQVDDNDLTEPEKALLLGPLRSLARQIPHLTNCHVDIIQQPSQNADERVWLLDRLAAEAQFAAPQAGVAYRGRRRWTRAFEPFPLPSPAPGQQLRPRGVYLIVGDHGAIGLHIADFLGRSCQAQVIVLLPAPAPDPARWEGLEAEISVLAGDLPADEAIGTAVSGIEERFGPLNGVIHTALMSTETDEDLRQLGLQGLRALDLALAGRPLDFCCVCTPLAPFLGGAGSHAAIAASLFADAFVTERRGRSAVPWQNIVWDAWVKDGGTVRDSTAPDRTVIDNAPKDREHDRHAMTAKEGVVVLRRALVAAEERQLVVSTEALVPRLDAWLRGRSVLPLAEPPEPDEAVSRPQLEADYVAPRNATEEAIVDLWSELLGFEQLGVDDNFFELGGDSLLATRLLS
ncbi:MAG: beta-ketoacyl synthase N-terminal-like domain-containing protein, partial [Acidobacteriota bacterium]